MDEAVLVCPGFARGESSGFAARQLSRSAPPRAGKSVHTILQVAGMVRVSTAIASDYLCTSYISPHIRIAVLIFLFARNTVVGCVYVER